jgi:hypothetical protein
MTSGGDRRWRSSHRLHEAGNFFPFPSRISQFKVECIIPTPHLKTCFDRECPLSLTASVVSSTGSRWPFGSLNKRVPPQGAGRGAQVVSTMLAPKGRPTPDTRSGLKWLLNSNLEKQLVLCHSPFAAPRSAQKNGNGIGQHIQTHPGSTMGQKNGPSHALPMGFQYL